MTKKKTSGTLWSATTFVGPVELEGGVHCGCQLWLMIYEISKIHWKHSEIIFQFRIESQHDKTDKMAYAPSEDSDQPGHPPRLISVFAVRMKTAWTLSYPLSAQLRLWSYRIDAQVDLSLRRAHSHFVGFVMRRLSYSIKCPHFH